MDRHGSSSHGRPKTEEHNVSDRLSTLPGEVIILIISLLEMKDAVKTGILSKRWKDLWNHVDNIVFKCPVVYDGEQHMSDEEIEDIEEPKNIKQQQYISFIDVTLMRCTGPDIKSFYLHCVNETIFQKSFNAQFRKWIAHVLEKNVEFLTLKFEEDSIYVPDCLYRSSTLTKLELDGVRVKTFSPVDWGLLKSLSFGNMTVNDLCIDYVLVGCPVLETLALRAVCGILHLNIISSSVKRLELVDFQDDTEKNEDTLQIRAPLIQELVILEKFLVTKFKLVDVTSLVKATLNFTSLDWGTKPNGETTTTWTAKEYEYYKDWIRMVANVLQSVSYVDELIIGSEPIQVLSLSKLLGKPSPLFRRCKRISITSPLWKFDLPGIVCLLENGPHLETLFIKVLRWEKDVPLPQTVELFKKEVGPFSLPIGNLVHLKNVKFDYSPEHSYSECLDFEIIEYILRGAVAVKRLVLSSSSRVCCRSRILNLSVLVSNLLTTIKVAKWDVKEINGMFEFSFLRRI